VEEAVWEVIDDLQTYVVKAWTRRDERLKPERSVFGVRSKMDGSSCLVREKEKKKAKHVKAQNALEFLWELLGPHYLRKAGPISILDTLCCDLLSSAEVPPIDGMGRNSPQRGCLR